MLKLVLNNKEVLGMVSIDLNNRGLNLAIPPAKSKVVQQSTSSVDSGALAAIRRAFKSLKSFYNEKMTISISLRNRFIWLKQLMVKGGNMVSNSVKFSLPNISTFRNSTLAGEGLLSKVGEIVKYAKKTRVFSVIAIPATIVSIVKNSVGLTRSYMNNKPKLAFEKGMMLVGDSGEL